VINAVISRDDGKRQTRGCLYVFDGDRSILNVKTLELPYLNNQKSISCIPPDTYEVRKIIRPNGNIAFEVMNVPGRTNILFHSGNYASGVNVDTEGCILPGMRFADINADGELDVVQSVRAMELLYDALPDTFKLHIL